MKLKQQRTLWAVLQRRLESASEYGPAIRKAQTPAELARALRDACKEYLRGTSPESDRKYLEQVAKAGPPADERLTVDLVCTHGPVTVVAPREITGWGEESHEVTVNGDVASICVSRGGELQFGLRIESDGRLTLTDYGHMCFRTHVPQNVQFIPHRPWKAEQQTDDA